jgi:hypothetical protein
MTSALPLRTLRRLASIPLLLFSVSAVSAAATPSAAVASSGGVVEALLAQAPALGREVLELALDAAGCAATAGVVARPELLTVIDYSLPSTEPRLWVFDLDRQRLLYEELVAHGKNSGDLHSTFFSNELGSLASSMGLFVTAESYVGRHGYSLRLNGLEPGVNDRARERAIVVHGAPYVSPETATALGRLGRSWGCPAVRKEIASDLIDAIQGGTAVFSYYPDETWLAGSKYLSRCTAPGGGGSAGPDTRLAAR